jgi:GntR family transcriptional regulator
MPFWVQISSGSNEPIYSQVVGQISRALAQGLISPGEKLPAVRNLAAELVINPNTVARAYTILEQQGLVTTKTGSGTYASDPRLRDKDVRELNILNDRVDNIITQALNLGLSHEEIVELLRGRLSKFSSEERNEKGRDSDE